MDQAINTIRNRIDQLGVGEVVIQKHGGPGENEILVQLPGVTDPARVKNIMQSTAQLELKLVDSGPYPSQAAAAQNYRWSRSGESGSSAIGRARDARRKAVFTLFSRSRRCQAAI